MDSATEEQMKWAIETFQKAAIDVVGLVSSKLKDDADAAELDRTINLLERIHDQKVRWPLFEFLQNLSGYCQHNEGEIGNPGTVVRLMTAMVIGKMGVTPTRS